MPGRGWVCVEDIKHDTFHCNWITGKKQTIGGHIVEACPRLRGSCGVFQPAKQTISYNKEGFITDEWMVIDIHQWAVLWRIYPIIRIYQPM